MKKGDFPVSSVYGFLGPIFILLALVVGEIAYRFLRWLK